MAIRRKEITMRKIMVLGGGAWGTAISNLLANNLSQNIYLWALEREIVREINEKNENSKFLPDINLSKKVIAVHSYEKIESDRIFIAAPSQYIYNLIKNLYTLNQKRSFTAEITFILCSKGIDIKRKALLSNLIKEIYPKSKVLVLSGPTFAKTLAQKKPTAATLAFKEKKIGIEVSKMLCNDYFKIYTTRDVIGVQINGTLKNVLALAAGITEGSDLGENARAAIITRGIQEIVRVIISLGGKKETVFGLSGLGDILLTCNSHNSRNFSMGYKLGKGDSIEKIISGRAQVTEGFENIKFINYIRKKHKLHLPIFEAVYKILIEKESIKKVAKNLLDRTTKKE